MQSTFSSWEAAEAEETMRMLRWVEKSSTHMPRSDKFKKGGFDRRTAAVPMEPDEVIQMPEIPEEVIDITSQNAMSSLDGEEGSFTIVSERDVHEEGSGGQPRNGSYDQDADDDLSDMFSELSRIPALIETIGRDQLIFHVPDDESSFLQQQATRLSASEILRRGSAWGGAPSDMELQTPFPSTGMYPSAPSSNGADDDGENGDGEELASSFEFVVPMPRKPVVSGGASTSGGGVAAEALAVPMETLDMLADQVAQSVVRGRGNNGSGGADFLFRYESGSLRSDQSIFIVLSHVCSSVSHCRRPPWAGLHPARTSQRRCARLSVALHRASPSARWTWLRRVRSNRHSQIYPTLSPASCEFLNSQVEA